MPRIKENEQKKGMMDFVVKDVTVNEYESLFEALAGTRKEPHPKLDQFVGLFQAFKTAIKDEAGPSWQSGTNQALTVDDILQLPKFAKNKEERTKKTTPTILHCISHKDFRDAMQRKVDKKEEDEKAKLAKQAKREQVKKQKKEQKALNAKKREERAQRKMEMERKKKERVELQKILKGKGQGKESDSDEEDQQLRMAMERDLEAEIDIEEDPLMQLHRDLCMGCHRKGMDGNV